MLIKFKAIDTKNNIISEPFCLPDIHSGGLCNTKSLYANCEEHIIIQFTNSRDDYGNEIYEGDILNNEVEVYYNTNWSAYCVRKIEETLFHKFLYQYIVDNDDIKITGNVNIKDKDK